MRSAIIRYRSIPKRYFILNAPAGRAGTLRDDTVLAGALLTGALVACCLLSFATTGAFPAVARARRAWAGSTSGFSAALPTVEKNFGKRRGSEVVVFVSSTAWFTAAVSLSPSDEVNCSCAFLSSFASMGASDIEVTRTGRLRFARLRLAELDFPAAFPPGPGVGACVMIGLHEIHYNTDRAAIADLRSYKSHPDQDRDDACYLEHFAMPARD